MTPRLLAWLVAAGGLIDLVSALFPRPGAALGFLARFAPGVAGPAAHVLVVPAGVVLVLTSRGLVRRNRRGWRLAVTLLGLSVLLQLLRGPGYAGAIVTGLTALALLARRDDFPHRGDPAAEPSALLRLSVLLLAAVLYGVTAVWVYRTASGLPFSPASALLDTLRAMGGQLPGDVDLLPAEFTEWFPVSVLSIVAIGVIWAAAVWIRPWRQRLFPDAGRRGQAAEIVRRWGADTLAPFTLRSDKEWFVTGRTLIAYRVVRGVALVSGDPIGPPGETAPSLETFLAHARARGWRTAVLGASGQLLDIYQDLGMRPLYHGDEAVIDVHGLLPRRPPHAHRPPGRAPARTQRLPRGGASWRATCRPPCARSWPRSSAPGFGAGQGRASRWSSTACSGSAAATRYSSSAVTRTAG